MTPTRTLGALRPMEAYRALSRFEGRRGPAAMRLAMHAAVPQSFRPDLLHLLKLNFVPEAADDPAVEADVLLAPFSDDLGGGYFQFDPEVRRLLLDELGDAYADEPVLRVRRVADFLLAYVERAERRAPASHDRLGREFLHTQKWVALAFARPEAAAEQLASALKRDEQAPTLEARLHLGGLAHAVAIPLAHHRQLLDYALALHALETGDQAAAADLLEPLQREFTVGPVTLTPGRVMPPRPAPPAQPVEDAATPDVVAAAAQSHGVGESSPDAETPLRVFISGTLMDLGEYRQAAADVCRRLGLEPLMVESWAAEERSRLDRTLAELERADLYLCLVSHRYGYVPLGSFHSLSEMEFDHARSLGIPMLGFLVEEERLPADPDPAKVRALREKVRAHTRVSVVDDEAEFRERLSARLGEWKVLRASDTSADRVPDEQGTPTPSRPRSLFLSYGQRGRYFAERLYRDLQRAGFQVWMDGMEVGVPDTPPQERPQSAFERLVARVRGEGVPKAQVTGADAREARIQDALGAADGLVLVVTEETHARKMELRLALESGKPVFPVIRAGKGPPVDIQRYPGCRPPLDFRKDRPYHAAFEDLVRLLGGASVDGMGFLYGVPRLPATYVARKDELAHLRDFLIAGEPRVTVLIAPAGAGKTTLASALVHEVAIRQRFPGGIVWVAEHPDAGVEQVLAALSRALGDDVPAASALYGKTCLLILDGAENARTVEHLATLVGVRGHVLVTSRSSDLASRLGAQSLLLGRVSPSEAMELLAGHLGVSADQLPPEAQEVAAAVRRQLDRLILVAKQVRAGTSWSALLRRLRSEGPRALEQGGTLSSGNERFDEMRVYICYTSEDRAAAERLAAGLEQVAYVWLDRERLPVSEHYEGQIRRRISRSALFVPVLSRNVVTTARRFFRHEWSVAEQELRTTAPDMPFIVPVIIDDLPVGAEGVPRAFWESHATVLPGGEVTSEFLASMRSRLRRVESAMHSGASAEAQELRSEPVVKAPVSRAASGPRPEITRILFVSVRTGASLDLDLEFAGIEREFKLAGKRDRLSLRHMGTTTFDKLMQAMLDEPPTIVHFWGGGGMEGILSQGDAGEVLENVFARFRDTVRCVVLNGCWSESQAKAIRRHVPYVVGSRAGISDDTALAFSAAFYQAIAGGKDVPFAFRLGQTRVQIEREEDVDLVTMI